MQKFILRQNGNDCWMSIQSVNILSTDVSPTSGSVIASDPSIDNSADNRCSRSGLPLGEFGIVSRYRAVSVSRGVSSVPEPGTAAALAFIGSWLHFACDHVQLLESSLSQCKRDTISITVDPVRGVGTVIHEPGVPVVKIATTANRGSVTFRPAKRKYRVNDKTFRAYMWSERGPGSCRIVLHGLEASISVWPGSQATLERFARF